MAGRYLVRIFSDMEIEAENEKEAIQTFKDLHIESDDLTPFISAKYLGETKITPNKVLSPATSEEMHMARADVYDNGIPPTPAKWQRAFKWSYCKASDALDRIRQEFDSPATV